MHPELIRDVYEEVFIDLFKKKYGIYVGYRTSSWKLPGNKKAPIGITL